jgi:cytoskeleton protein RodZ
MGTALKHHASGAHFGEFLRGARERRGLTLRDVSNETKIPWRHLDAFEHGDLMVVPNGMYRRAEVRAYARAVGLDQKLALEELEQALVTSVPSSPEAEPVPTSTRPRPVLATFGTAAIAGVLLVTLQMWSKRSEPQPQIGAVPVSAVAPAPSSEHASAAPSTSATPVRPAQYAPTATPASAPARTAVPAGAPTTDERATPAADNALVVTTDPGGARVTVDGIGWGTTPVRIRFLTPGDKTIRVIKDGFASEERTVRITDGRSTSVHVPLRTSAN